MLPTISIFSPLIPLILFLIFCTNKKTKIELWVIFFYILETFILDLVQRLTRWGRANHFEIFGVLEIVEFIVFVYFFYLAIGSRAIKKWMLIASVLILALLVITFANSEKTNFNSITASVESIAIIGLSIIFLFEQINKPPDFSIYGSANFWVVLSILIYMSSTLFLFIIANNLSDEEISKYWIINNISNTVSSITFGIAFLVSRFASSNPVIEKPPFIDYTNIPQKP